MLWSPELNLLRQSLWSDGFCRFAMDHKTALPLCPRHKKNPHTAFFRQVRFDSLDMGRLPGKAHAGASVDAPLQHLKSIVLEPFAKVVGRLALWLRANG